MIRELSIRNLAVVKAVDMSFERGLHVLTGETGAGKSIMIDAISLILGVRGSAEFVRHQAHKAEVTALFELETDHPVWRIIDDFGLGADDEESLLIKREISHRGKSTCRINGQIVTLAMLKQIGSKLMDVHGQHDHQSLLREDEHITWLDAFAGESLNTLKQQYRKLYNEYREVKQELQRLSENERETAQRMDLLQFQAQEIAAAKLEPGEDEQLQQKRTKLTHMEKIVQHVQDAYTVLRNDNQVMNDVGQAMAQIETVSQYDSELNEVLDFIKNAYYQLEEAATTLGRFVEVQEYDQHELNEVEARLFLIEQLKRKYAPSVNEILQFAEQAMKELEILNNREIHTQHLQHRHDVLHAELKKKAAELTVMRQTAAQSLQQAVEGELQDLHMKHTKFCVAFHAPDEETNRRLFSNGWDRLSFAIAANPGEPPKPLAKIASGGELSRIMLALKTIFHKIDQVDTLIFDEIDSGVSGRAAQAIAEKMHRIAQKRQVLCVTHLPQVACMADCHFYIAKQVAAGNTATHVNTLSHEGRIREMARMLGGVEVTHKTRQHAEEMLRLAEKRKQGA